MAGKIISLRSQLIGEINDFLADEGMACADTAFSLMEIIVLVSKYREEGIPYYPEVVICDDLQLVKKVLLCGDYIFIGNGKRNKDTARKALKECVPLAKDGWAVLLHRTDGGFDYGLLRTGGQPISLTPRDILDQVSDSTKGLGLFYIVQLAENTVELKGSGGRTSIICFNDARTEWEKQDNQDPRNIMSKLVSKITQRNENDIREQCHIFFRRILWRAIQRSHGTLIAVVNCNNENYKSFLRDGIFLKENIDIAKQVKEYLYDKNPQSSARLDGSANLLEGMLNSDGITIISDNGQVCGFRVFITNDSSTTGDGNGTGGARRRAYNELRSRLGPDLIAAFYRSQDGKMECEISTGV